MAALSPIFALIFALTPGLSTARDTAAQDSPAPAPASPPDTAAPAAPATSADAAPPAAPAQVRVTSSFEVKHAAAVLKQVAKLFRAGFVRKDAEEMAREIELLPADQSRRWEFTVTYKHVSLPLQMRARLDDFGMLDLDFFCAPAAAAAVRGAVDGYLNSRGL